MLLSTQLLRNSNTQEHWNPQELSGGLSTLAR